MKSSRIITSVLAFACALLLTGPATASGLTGFLDEIEIRASKDMGSFRADLSLTFDVSDGTVDGLFAVMPRASDVYMCLRVGEVAEQPIDRVVEEFERHKGEGWGVIARSLGIKPGSEEFHALKAGRLGSNESAGSPGEKGKGKRKS